MNSPPRPNQTYFAQESNFTIHRGSDRTYNFAMEWSQKPQSECKEGIISARKEMGVIPAVINPKQVRIKRWQRND